MMNDVCFLFLIKEIIITKIVIFENVNFVASETIIVTTDSNPFI